MAAEQATRPRPGVALGPLIRPQEHGVYGLWAEPVALGLLLAPSWPGVALALAVLGDDAVAVPGAAGSCLDGFAGGDDLALDLDGARFDVRDGSLVGARHREQAADAGWRWLRTWD